MQVLALWGEADPWTPLNTGTHAGASLGQHLETFELVVLPETGHCPHDESPEECHEGVLTYRMFFFRLVICNRSWFHGGLTVESWPLGKAFAAVF